MRISAVRRRSTVTAILTETDRAWTERGGDQGRSAATPAGCIFSRCTFFLGLAISQETAEQPALALARDQIDIADEFRSALASFQRDLAAVIGLELDAMSHADDRCLWQFLHQHFHHLVLALLVERGRSLVQNHDIRAMQQQSRERQTLLL